MSAAPELPPYTPPGLPEGMPTTFGTIMADPPWAYIQASNHDKLTGYSTGHEYPALSTDDLCALPIEKYADDNAVLVLWTTWPFLQDAFRVIEAWGFVYVTALPWVKATSLEKSLAETEGAMRGPKNLKPIYGVGYWMRGCSEVFLIAKRPKGASVRTNYIGLISENFAHSRKPDSIYELAECFLGPRLELFARRPREGWYQLGNEVPGDGLDIRDRII